MQPLPLKPLNPTLTHNPARLLKEELEKTDFVELTTAKLLAFKRVLLDAVEDVRAGIRDAEEYLPPPRTITKRDGYQYTSRIRGPDRVRMSSLKLRRGRFNHNLAIINGILRERTAARRKLDMAKRVERHLAAQQNKKEHKDVGKKAIRLNRILNNLRKIRSVRAQYKKALWLAHEERRRICPDQDLIRWCAYYVVKLKPKIKGAKPSFLSEMPEAPRPSAPETDPTTSTES